MSSETVAAILRALHEAALEAQRITEEEQVRQLRRYTYLREDDPSVTPRQEGRLRTVSLHIPDATGDPRQHVKVDIPLLALMPPTSLRIRDLTVRFRAKLLGLDRDESDESGSGQGGTAINASLTAGEDGEHAEFRVTFESGEPPEALARLIEQVTLNALP